jgi:hypothetical protein
MVRIIIAILLFASVYPAFAQFNGCSFGLCGGSSGLGNSGGGFSPGGGGGPISCGSPDAPNGVVDLSKCSNAFYVATILF